MTETSTPLVPLSADQLKKVTFIEQFYSENGDFPPDGFFEDKFPGTNLYIELQNPTFALALKNRGIERLNKVSGLTESQMAAISTVLDYNDKRTRRSKLASLDINTQTWNGWMKNPVFRNYFIKVSNEVFDNSIQSIQESVINSAEAGNITAAKFFYEVTGRLQTGEKEKNIQVLITRLIESIQRHVKDPTILSAIAADFQLINSGLPESEPPKFIEGKI